MRESVQDGQTGCAGLDAVFCVTGNEDGDSSGDLERDAFGGEGAPTRMTGLGVIYAFERSSLLIDAECPLRSKMVGVGRLSCVHVSGQSATLKIRLSRKKLILKYAVVISVFRSNHSRSTSAPSALSRRLMAGSDTLSSSAARVKVPCRAAA